MRAFFAGLLLLYATPLRARQDDWLRTLREEVDAHHLKAALAVADQRLAAAPGDTDAMGWRARTLGWLGQTKEAEQEFRTGLALTPNDPDLLSGLAGVLVTEQRQGEALFLLNQAIAIDPGRTDILDQRGSLLRAMGHTAKARSDYRVALAKNPGDEEARAGLDSLISESRHEMRIGSDTDTFNYTGTANAETLELISHWNSRWTTDFAGIFYQRFGANAGKFTGTVARKFGRSDSLAIGGAIARDRGVIPRAEAFVEYGHGFKLSETNFLRGLETDFGSHWYWYRDARVLGLTPAVVFYMPRDATFSIAFTQARSAFSGTGSEWRPSGMAKLSVPLSGGFTPNIFFAEGTENFAEADQIGRFSGRTIGAGAKYRFARRQDITFYVAHQSRTQGREQTSFGVSYGIDF